MNGATAEPWVSTTKPPNIAITSKRGSSHNFLRTRRKCQSSCKNSISTPSEQVLHAVRGGSRRCANDPIRLTWLARVGPQRIASARPHDQGSRKNAEEENEAHDDRSHDMVQQLAEPEPQSIEWMQDAGISERGREKRNCQHPRPT